MTEQNNTTLQQSQQAVWSAILGAVSIFAFWFLCIPAVVLGHDALRRMRCGEVSDRRQGIAIAGLVIGYMSLVFLAIGLLAGYRF